MNKEETIQQYQLLYEKNPQSKVFSPLSEAYRKGGSLKRALQIAQEGVKRNPDFASGRVALGRALLDARKINLALPHLERAVQLNPENILAYNLIAESYLKLKAPKRALEAFQMILFLNPYHKKAQIAVKKLESLTTDAYDTSGFEMKPLTPPQTQTPFGEVGENSFVTANSRNFNDLGVSPTPLRSPQTPPPTPLRSPQTPPRTSPQWQVPEGMEWVQTSQGQGLPPEVSPPKPLQREQLHLDRCLSLIDTYIARNDLNKAIQAARSANEQFPQHPEIQRRLKTLQFYQIKEKKLNTLRTPASKQKRKYGQRK